MKGQPVYAPRPCSVEPFGADTDERRERRLGLLLATIERIAVNMGHEWAWLYVRLPRMSWYWQRAARLAVSRRVA